MQKFSYKILLPPAGSSFSSLKVFEDCSGGNSRPSRPSGVGGGTFLLTNVCLFPLALARDHALARLAPERNAQRTTHNAQRPTSNVEVSKFGSRYVANCVDARGAHRRNDGHRDFCASRDLACAHGAAKYSRTRTAGEGSARGFHRHCKPAAAHHHQ